VGSRRGETRRGWGSSHASAMIDRSSNIYIFNTATWNILRAIDTAPRQIWFRNVSIAVRNGLRC
jgi:hypothetical protein